MLPSSATVAIGRPHGERVDAAALTDAIERLLSAGIGVTTTAIDETAEAADLTLAQWRVLVVAGQTAGVRIGVLAAALGLSVPSASRLVRRVEARALLVTKRAPDDRRATVVSLTRAGRTLVDAVVGRRRNLIRRALDDQIDRSFDTVTLLHDLADRLMTTP